ncbi:unnamed protein product [Choristocarpus tenellus]
MRFAVLLAGMVALLVGAFGFQIRVPPAGGLTSSASWGSTTWMSTARSSPTFSTRPKRRLGRSCVSMQFGEDNSNQGSMPTFEEEKEKDFFKSKLDKASNEDKLKDPVLLIALGWILAIGVASVGFILYGVN